MLIPPAVTTAVVWVMCVNGVTAGQIERRDFSVSVDGKLAGTYCITIRNQDDGTTHVACRADVRVSFLVFRYSYTFRGTETWAGNQLQKLESTANDNGKQLALSARLKGKMLHIRAQGRERNTVAEVWPTSYWRLPDAKFHNGSVTLLDADTGREIKAQLQFIGTKRLDLGGKPSQCRHFRVTGDTLHIDLWYDNNNRLVRQESAEDGHQTVIEAISIREERGAGSSKPSPGQALLRKTVKLASLGGPDPTRIEPGGQVMPDRESIRQALVEMLEADKGEPVGAFDDARNLREEVGLDSLDVVSLVSQIERQYRVRLTHEELQNLVTAGDVLDLLQAKLIALAA